MNLVITNRCNKNCSLCFAKGFKSLDKIDMDISFIKSLPKVINSNPDIGLLGGEPTQHPKFFEILDILYNKYYIPLIFSNFNFNFDVTKELIKYNYKYDFIKYMVNLTYDNVSSIPDNVINNIKILNTQILNKQTGGQNISISYTISPNSLNNAQYIESLYKKLNYNYRLRLSIAFPSDNNKDINYKHYINNKDMGKDIIDILLFCKNNNIDNIFDCNIYPCMFDNVLEFETLCNKYSYKCNLTQGYDIFPDKTASNCFPLRIETNTPYSDSSKNYINNKYIDLRSKVVVEECLYCEYFRSKICLGPCYALLK